MKNIRYRFGFGSVATIALMSMPGVTLAQTQSAGDAAPQQSATSTGLEEILVTAERRSESLNRTPVSVSVVSSKELAEAAITSDQDLRVATPGLGVRAGYGSNQLNYVIRGQSQDPFSNSRPGVLPYFNEVQINGSGAASAFYDLQSVQVLKGPQGTLFGRSATGGALLFTTVKPSDKLGGYGSVSLGDFNSRKVEGALNVPLAGDQLMARVSGLYQKRDGYQRNVFDGSRGNDVDRYGVRGSLTAKFRDTITNELVVDYYHANNTNITPVISGLLAPAAGSRFPYVPTPLLYGGVTTPAARATGAFILGAFTGLSPAAAQAQYDAYFAAPHHPPGGFAAVFATQQATGPYVVNADGFSQGNARNTLVANTTTFDLGSDTRVKNIFGYTNLYSTNTADADGSPYGLDQGGGGPRATSPIPNDKNKAATDELQLIGVALDRRLDYVVGGYVSHETTESLRSTDAFDILSGTPSNSKSNFKLTNSTYAPYAQGSYHLGDSGLAFTLGTRYTSEKVEYQTLPQDDHLVSPAPPGISFDQSRTFKKLSWTIGLQDQINDDLMIYATSRRAYKSGGFNGLLNPVVGSAAVGGNGFDAQSTTDVEFGTKYYGNAGSIPVRLNLAGFRIWTADEQRTVYALAFGSPSALTVNVPKTNVYGAEFDGQIKPATWLTFGGSANYLHSEFAGSGVTVLGVAQNYDQVPDAPKFTGGVFADLTMPISGSLSGSLHFDVYRQSFSTISTNSANSAGTGMDGYTLANLRVGIRNDAAGWSLTANLKNAFDKTYYVGGLPLGQLVGFNLLVPGEPRSFTVEMRYDF